ncbi:MAG: sugar phosphorylase [Anaerolineae bacterium]|nr:MAG: sugar phosphorylase [Anaerolineae bacterium]
MITPSERIYAHLHQIYSHDAAENTYRRLMEVLGSLKLPVTPFESYFSERDVTLITYGDTLYQDEEKPLQTLRRFVSDYLKSVVSTVHILPFYPYSSDDGFSVIDYYAVDENLGTWDDIEQISREFKMMFDAVINHMSSQSPWFTGFLADDPAYRGLFFTESLGTDLSGVTRPRTTPLLTEFTKTSGAAVHLWTTFSADQIDLDYRSPETLLRIVDVLLFYVQHGAQVIRLDAIAYMWKEVGTSCIHLPETHAIIQLFRAVLDHVAPHVILITETNVPHEENISYFGNGANEAQMVYNFTLPPLLLYSIITGGVHKLAAWMNTLSTPSPQTTFFNFTASHDGIGVRPVEGILEPSELERLVHHVQNNSGRISYKNNPDGSRSPYELNITYVDAIGGVDGPSDVQIRRFMLSQAVKFALAGVPAVYIHSLLGSHNNIEGMLRTGHNRTINRARLDARLIRGELNDPTSFRGRIFRMHVELLNARSKSPAFHPKAEQKATALHNGRVLMLEREAETEKIVALYNFTGQPQAVQLAIPPAVDLLTGKPFPDGEVTLAPYGFHWLRISKS